MRLPNGRNVATRQAVHGSAPILPVTISNDVTELPTLLETENVGSILTMCGRFTQKLTWRQIHDLYDLTAPAVPLNLQPRYNGAPEQEFAACRLDDGGNRTTVQLRWGLVPSCAKTQPF